MRINKKNVYFVLVEPQTPGNIGAAARALKTMGFSNLILINPCDHLAAEARWMAHASNEILEKAQIFSHLEEFIKDMNWVVATTQRDRNYHLPFYTPKEFCERAVPMSVNHKIAIVFGREQSGLTNEELSMCDAISTIPAHTKHPSLNLAQSIMVYAYEMFQYAYEDLKEYPWKLATHGELTTLYNHMRQALQKADFVPIDNWENFTVRFSRLLGRAQAEKRDIKVWHKIFKSFEQKIEELEAEIKSLKSKDE
ncbi:MAG: RNA methyltransferase [Calditrichia bacterium]